MRAVGRNARKEREQVRSVKKKVGKFLSLQRRCNTVWSEKEVLRNNLFQRERGDTETGGVSQIAYLLAKHLKFWVHKWAQGVHTDKYVNKQWKEKKKYLVEQVWNLTRWGNLDGAEAASQRFGSKLTLATANML